MFKFTPVRWSGENDRYFGPFTYCGSDYSRIALMLGSGDGEYPRCRLRMQLGKQTLIVVLPQWVLRPYREWIDTSKYEWSKGEGSGYWDTHEREFGFSYSEKALHVHFGPQTHDSTTSKNKVYFIPWLNWRHVRTSHYGLQGEHYHTEPKGLKWTDPAYEASRVKVDACPSAQFVFKDYDDQEIVATTTIQEREWRFGEGHSKWLSIFAKPMVRRSLDIKFSAEVGPEKGSWKGGTIGHGIDMLDGELHEAAFKRYCEKEHRSKSRKYQITYIGPKP